MTQKEHKILSFLSNTVMTVVPDSNRIPYYLLSKQLFKPHFHFYIQFSWLYHSKIWKSI